MRGVVSAPMMPTGPDASLVIAGPISLTVLSRLFKLSRAGQSIKTPATAPSAFRRCGAIFVRAAEILLLALRCISTGYKRLAVVNADMDTLKRQPGESLIHAPNARPISARVSRNFNFLSKYRLPKGLDGPPLRACGGVGSAQAARCAARRIDSGHSPCS